MDLARSWHRRFAAEFSSIQFQTDRSPPRTRSNRYNRLVPSNFSPAATAKRQSR